MELVAGWPPAGRLGNPLAWRCFRLSRFLDVWNKTVRNSSRNTGLKCVSLLGIVVVVDTGFLCYIGGGGGTTRAKEIR